MPAMRAPNSYVLREATNADQPAIWTLISTVLRTYGIATDLRTTDQDLVDIRASYANKAGCFFVLLDGHRLIGTVALTQASESSCELCRMYLDSEYRSQGLGRLLLDKAISEAKDRSYAEMHLKTAAVLVDAICLYESVGFVRTSDVPVSKNCNLAMTMQLA
jgi:putative acetyltransferase